MCSSKSPPPQFIRGLGEAPLWINWVSTTLMFTHWKPQEIYSWRTITSLQPGGLMEAEGVNTKTLGQMKILGDCQGDWSKLVIPQTSECMTITRSTHKTSGPYHHGGLVSSRWSPTRWSSCTCLPCFILGTVSPKTDEGWMWRAVTFREFGFVKHCFTQGLIHSKLYCSLTTIFKPMLWYTYLL